MNDLLKNMAPALESGFPYAFFVMTTVFFVMTLWFKHEYVTEGTGGRWMGAMTALAVVSATFAVLLGFGVMR